MSTGSRSRRLGKPRRWVRLLAGAALASALLAGCDAAEPAPPGALSGTLTVFAASSLTDAFDEAASTFEREHPGLTVKLNFASSSALATQLNEGAPADLFASADAAQMRIVTDRGNASDPQVFATNLPVVVVPAGSSAVTAFADLVKPGIKLVLAGRDVPIGRYAREVLARASGAGGISPDFGERVLRNLKSEETNVRAVLAKVALGEADAGIVYTTDAAAGGDDVRVITIPQGYNVVAEYPIAVLKEAGNRAATISFIDYLTGPRGQAILKRHGFGIPGQ
jgi:molybdate transport system substrate-binding protein